MLFFLYFKENRENRGKFSGCKNREKSGIFWHVSAFFYFLVVFLLYICFMYYVLFLVLYHIKSQKIMCISGVNEDLKETERRN